MFGFFKNLIRKPSAQPVEDETYAESQPASELPPAEMPAGTQTEYAPSAFRGTGLRRNVPAQNGKGIEVPLQAILAGLPMELQPRVRQNDVGDAAISVPLERVLAQLSRGAVRISFGELRQAAPDVFTAQNDRDRVLVCLPLAEILSRLNPALITRRRVQRQIEVPEDIHSPFDGRGEGLVFSVGPGKPAGEPAPARAVQPAHPVHPVARQVAPPAPPAPPAPARAHLAAVPTPPPPAAMPMPPAPPRANPAAAPAPAAPTAFVPPAPLKPAAPIAFNPAAVPTAPPPPPIAPAPQPKVVVAPVAPAVRKAPAPAPMAPPRAAPAPVAPAPLVASVPVEPPAAESDGALAGAEPVTGQTSCEPPLLVDMTAVAEGWPEAVRKEIVNLRAVESRIGLPMEAVEQALRLGRIAFSWRTLRVWIQPAVPPVNSAHDGTALELPLRVVAPLFLARKREHAAPVQRVTVDEEIPNLFFGFPQPEPETPVAQATARPADTNYYVWGDTSDTAQIHESEVRRGPSPGTKFVAKYATPNEVVSRAAALDGVAGALIALPDGLLVANRLPPELNAETLAAFLPQIFGKVSQCTKELRMGELNNLNFTVGNVPWKIFRVNAIFFAAFGRSGEPLPTAQLAALAAELDHKPK